MSSWTGLRYAQYFVITAGMTVRPLPSYTAKRIYLDVKNDVYVKILSYLDHPTCCPGSEDSAEYDFAPDQIR